MGSPPIRSSSDLEKLTGQEKAGRPYLRQLLKLFAGLRRQTSVLHDGRLHPCVWSKLGTLPPATPSSIHQPRCLFQNKYQSWLDHGRPRFCRQQSVSNPCELGVTIRLVKKASCAATSWFHGHVASHFPQACPV